MVQTFAISLFAAAKRMTHCVYGVIGYFHTGKLVHFELMVAVSTYEMVEIAEEILTAMLLLYGTVPDKTASGVFEANESHVCIHSQPS